MISRQQKILLTITLILFAVITTTYFWEALIGLWVIPLTVVLFFTFFILCYFLVVELKTAVREKFRNGNRVIVIIAIAIILALIFFEPFGIIPFEKFEGKDLLIAERESVADCHTIFKLKEGNKFTEKGICFGIEKRSGSYALQNDTIRFTDFSVQSKKDPPYQFAVIEPNKIGGSKAKRCLVLYDGEDDTLPFTLFITKNELPAKY